MEANDIISSGLLELYATGVASAEEAQQVELWVKQYPAVAAELAAIEAGLETYAHANAVEPDPVIKAKLFQQITKTQATTKVIAPVRSISTGFWKFAAAASILLLIGSIALNVTYFNKYSEADKDLKESQDQLAEAMKSNGEMKNDMGIVQSRYSMPVGLKSVKPTTDAAAKIFWMQNTGDVYIDPSNLPDAPQGKQYQLWAIVDGKPVDAGMIITAKSGAKYRIQKMKSFGSAQAFAITLEKEGGNPTPTMDQMVVMGKL